MIFSFVFCNLNKSALKIRFFYLSTFSGITCCWVFLKLNNTMYLGIAADFYLVLASISTNIRSNPRDLMRYCHSFFWDFIYMVTKAAYSVPQLGTGRQNTNLYWYKWFASSSYIFISFKLSVLAICLFDSFWITYL